MSKKLDNELRNWIHIGRIENEMKHLKARYKRFKEYSLTMPVEDIEISKKEVSKKLKQYKELRKKLIRQALVSSGKLNTNLKNDTTSESCCSQATTR